MFFIVHGGHAVNGVVSVQLDPPAGLERRATMRWHGRRPGVVTAVVVRHVLRRVKPAVRIREVSYYVTKLRQFFYCVLYY